MPFSIVKKNYRERFSEVMLNLAHIESVEPKEPAETPPYVKIQRGLYYVHLYSALEKTVNEVVEQTILIINGRGVKNKHFETNFNVISLNSKMQSFKSCGYKEYINKSVDVFKSIGSDESFEISNTIFSQSLQNVWFKIIEQTLDSFGASPIIVEPRVRYTIDEVVDKRNAVAHGRETPKVVGERHRADVLRDKTEDIQLVIDLFIDSFETYISDLAYIQ
ncbi:MAE_28990/MAE_18760 family HEPN-like nuclease [Desulfobacterales bacterium HSG2]|nr:MAE_28990/MAE_18760 family HEPN-like nuclease [Desulfobacterales bacterium HSG2]